MENQIGRRTRRDAIEGKHYAMGPARSIGWGAITMMMLSSNAFAKDAWTGSSLSDMFSSKSKISETCAKTTGQPDDVTGFLTALDGSRKKAGDFLASLVENTKAVQAAEKTKDLQKIKDASKAEAAKVRLWVSCDASQPKKLKMDVWAKNGDGTKIKLNPPGY